MKTITYLPIAIIIFIVTEIAFRIPKHCLSCPSKYANFTFLAIAAISIYMVIKVNQVIKTQRLIK